MRNHVKARRQLAFAIICTDDALDRNPLRRAVNFKLLPCIRMKLVQHEARSQLCLIQLSLAQRFREMRERKHAGRNTGA